MQPIYLKQPVKILRHHVMTLSVIALLTTLAIGSASASEVEEAPANQDHAASWLHDAGWGVFYHSLSDIYGPRRALTDRGYEQMTRPGNHPHDVMHRLTFFQQNVPTLSQDEWNEYIDEFDVDTLAKQLHEVGAGWFMVAIGQHSGLFCAPSSKFDQMMGFDQKTTTCSRRDLVADLAKALKPYNIRLLVYAAVHPPRHHQKVREVFADTDGALSAPTQEKWESVIQHWSEQWGDLVDGWWFDGGFQVPSRPESPNRESLISAAKSGNPNSIACINLGPTSTTRSAKNEDYTAGEFDLPLDVTPQGRWIDGRQWHMLSYLGEWWSWSAKPRFNNQQVIDMTSRIISAGGSVTWDIPLTNKGTLPKAFHDQLRVLGKAVKQK